MKNRFKKAAIESLKSITVHDPGIISDQDIRHLPMCVQKYLHVSGFAGKEKIVNFRVEFKGGIRSGPKDDYMPLRSVQYNFTENPARFFYIVAKKMGIPAKGVHIYKDRKASMLIKLLGLFTISEASGKEMDQGETVTLFNDMCFMAPGALIDKNIEWKEIDDLTTEAKFSNGEITIGATLYFNEKGELVNFLSNDRFESQEGGRSFVNYPWLTPVTGYTDINGYHLPSGARLIYRHPGGDFCYGEFHLAGIEYNCTEYR